ncbi:MAG: SUMF1/EgtB/PvdO family nonheme iron enzyme [Deltaproteobacteria bacterium]|nr:SUMF1/EgtB/PvdO family nonheme iron enzyme [Deltaproteobacteria bacterium]
MKRTCAVLTVLLIISFVAAGVYAADAKEAQTAAPAAKEAVVPKKDEAVPAKDEAAKDRKKLTPAEIAAFKEKQLKDIDKQLRMVYVKGGCYEMGDFSGMGDDDELPVHEVCVSDFYIADSEVTQALWLAVMGYQFNTPYDPDKPVVEMSFLFMSKFIVALNKLQKRYYRLPSEAEWEYAAREGGKKIKWAGTDDENAIGDYAWVEENSDSALHHVKKKKPNSLGIYDMSGNAWEWVEDYFDFDYYKTSPRKQPLGPVTALWRTLRGGSFLDDAIRTRTTYRYALESDKSMKNVGFRIAE